MLSALDKLVHYRYIVTFTTRYGCSFKQLYCKVHDYMYYCKIIAADLLIQNSYYYKYILTYLSSVSVKLSVKSKTFSYLILYFHIMALFKLSTVAHANVQQLQQYYFKYLQKLSSTFKYGRCVILVFFAHSTTLKYMYYYRYQQQHLTVDNREGHDVRVRGVKHQ